LSDLIGGGPYDMHNQAGATASTATSDLTADAPQYTPAANLNMGRMHLPPNVARLRR
jgi:hypothetical protein